jgi:hypothetical protein
MDRGDFETDMIAADRDQVPRNDVEVQNRLLVS